MDDDTGGTIHSFIRSALCPTDSPIARYATVFTTVSYKPSSEPGVGLLCWYIIVVVLLIFVSRRSWVAVGWEWEWVGVGGSGWEWVGVGGSGWEWVGVGGSGWEWQRPPSFPLSCVTPPTVWGSVGECGRVVAGSEWRDTERSAFAASWVVLLLLLLLLSLLLSLLLLLFVSVLVFVFLPLFHVWVGLLCMYDVRNVGNVCNVCCIVCLPVCGVGACARAC